MRRGLNAGEGGDVSPRSSGTPEHPARVLIFSMRNITHHVARCSGYEFEDVVCSCETADIIAPLPSRNSGYNLGRYVKALFGQEPRPINGDLRVDKEYELFFVYCPRDWDLRYVKLIEGLRDKCRRMVCVIGELWPTMIANSEANLRFLRNFDCIFSGLESSVGEIQAITGRPCYFIPWGVDALLFSPYPEDAARTIDVFNMGRRHEGLHRSLMARAAAGKFFYLYDTVNDFKVIDPREHRKLLAGLIKRSRYFIAYPPKFDMPAETGGVQELGARFFEGAAGGAVILGGPPRCAAFDACFDWQDAVITVDTDGEQIGAVIEDLESDPRRVARMRRHNVANSLRRHDWVYRWRQMLDRVGLKVPTRVIEREHHLDSLAKAVSLSDDDPAPVPTNPSIVG